jgi:hypothetical protein
MSKTNKTQEEIKGTNVVVDILQSLTRIVKNDDKSKRKEVIINSGLTLLGIGALMAIDHMVKSTDKDSKGSAESSNNDGPF